MPITIAVFVGEFRIAGSIVVERLAPHGRPQVVALQPEDELEHLFIEDGIESAEFLLRPSGQRRGFIIDENAAVFHLGLPPRVPARKNVEVRLLSRGHIRPPVPGGNADAGRQIEHAVDCPPFVAAHDNQCPIDSGNRLFHGLYHVGFPLSRDTPSVQFAFSNEFVYQRATAEGADEHHLPRQ